MTLPQLNRKSPSCLFPAQVKLCRKGDEGVLLFKGWTRPYRLFLIAAALALLMCLYPIRAREAAEDGATQQAAQETENAGVPAGADLSERTAAGCMLHQTLYYVPCGHSVQRRDALDARLVGLTRAALEAEIADVVPGATVTGFSAKEVDAAVSVEIPCPLHWVLRSGEDGYLHVYQNRDGETLSLVRRTDVPISRVSEGDRAELAQGRVFDDVQAMEGFLESMSS